MVELEALSSSEPQLQYEPPTTPPITPRQEHQLLPPLNLSAEVLTPRTRYLPRAELSLREGTYEVLQGLRDSLRPSWTYCRNVLNAAVSSFSGRRRNENENPLLPHSGNWGNSGYSSHSNYLGHPVQSNWWSWFRRRQTCRCEQCIHNPPTYLYNYILSKVSILAGCIMIISGAGGILNGLSQAKFHPLIYTLQAYQAVIGFGMILFESFLLQGGVFSNPNVKGSLYLFIGVSYAVSCSPLVGLFVVIVGLCHILRFY